MSNQVIAQNEAIINKLPTYPIVIFPDNTWKAIDIGDIQNITDSDIRFAKYKPYINQHIGIFYETYGIRLAEKVIIMIVPDEPVKNHNNLNKFASKLYKLHREFEYYYLLENKHIEQIPMPKLNTNVYGPCILMEHIPAN